MADRTEQIMDEAISWNIRLRDADSATWHNFTRWLEADAAHAEAYERVALLDQELEGLSPAPPRTGRPAREPASIGRWIAGGTAALAASVAAFVMLSPASTYTIRTEAGQTRSIALEGGTVIHLNGSTEITLDRDDPRFASVEDGEALFVVASDPDNAFRVEAGPATIRNLATVFNVEREGSTVEVGLAEGAVAVSADGQSVELSPGQVVRVQGTSLETAPQDASTIGGWRVGELSYSSATVAEVAQDVARTSGIAIRAEPSVADRRFSGTIIIDRDSEQLRRKLAALLNVDIRVADKEWVLAAPDR